MSNIIIDRSNEWFAVSNDGWRRSNAGRSAAELIREAVSNAFDMDDVTEVRVTLMPGIVSIEDNSTSGISDINLVTTIFMTDKEDSPTKRGRKGRGLKELISVAESAIVDTIGYKVQFASDRTTSSSERTRGTEVIVYVPEWQQDSIDEAVSYLHKFIPPPNINFYVNDVMIVHRLLKFSTTGYLETHVIKNGVQHTEYRCTNIDMIRLGGTDDAGWLYEMGIPVKEIDVGFHINVQQRIPLNDNRNSVDVYFMQSLYAAILEGNIEQLSDKDLRQDWVANGITHTNSQTQSTYVNRLYGNISKLAIKSTDKKANDIAKTYGYELIDTSKLTSSAENVLRRVVDTADGVAKLIDDNLSDAHIDAALVDPSGRFASVVKFICHNILGRKIEVKFFERVSHMGTVKLTDFDQSSDTIKFNIVGMDLSNPISPAIMSALCHELAHARYQDHSSDFTNEVQRIAGLMTELMLTRRDEILALAGISQIIPSNNRILIYCIDCGAPREIAKHDAHQISRCTTCTHKVRTARAKNRRMGHHD